MKEQAKKLFLNTQDLISEALEGIDTEKQFHEENWKRDNADSNSMTSGIKSGGGRTRVLSNGKIFEKAGVNFSSVAGNLPEDMSLKLTGKKSIAPFFATGISLVIHPLSPKVPTVHSNYRYLEVGNQSWFGGGADLTPYFFFEEDAQHFHRTLQKVCDNNPPMNYKQFKLNCDKYFYLPHRKEHRGVGGIFFDYLGKDEPNSLPLIFAGVNKLANSFLNSYLPIVEKRKSEKFDSDDKEFQLIRRGRYVEFNLLEDRGTQFGLKTCLLYTSPSPRDATLSRMPSSA